LESYYRYLKVNPKVGNSGIFLKFRHKIAGIIVPFSANLLPVTLPRMSLLTRSNPAILFTNYRPAGNNTLFLFAN